MTNEIPVSVDYTNRDYYSLKAALTTRVKDSFAAAGKTWIGTDPSDFGVTLIEAFSYMGDVINYYVDRVANESYILTATQRQSILNLANNYGYSVSGYRSAVASFSVSNERTVLTSVITRAVNRAVVTAASRTAGSGVTTITAAGHGFATNDSVTLASVDTTVNGTYLITYISASQFSVVTTTTTVLALTGLTGTATVPYVTYFSAHSFSVGQTVVVSGITPTAFNLTGVIASVQAGISFTLLASPGAVYSSGGTAVVSNTASLPVGTRFSVYVIDGDTQQQVVFTTTADVSLPASATTVVTGIQGEYATTKTGNDAIYGEQLASSSNTGLPNQVYRLASTQIVDSTVTVVLQKGTVYEKWTQVDHLVDYGPSDAVFSVSLDANNYSYITFGDGISGAIPTPSALIYANYLVGSGTLGNIVAGALTLYKVPGLNDSEVGALSQYIKVATTSTATGGLEPESNDSIRANAPLALTALNRAVTLADFANLSLRVSGVGKANASASSASSVTVYMGPQQNDDVAALYPGYNTAGTVVDPSWTSLKDDLATYMSDKIQIGTTLTISPPSYIPVFIGISYSNLGNYDSSIVAADIKSKLLLSFSYNYMLFADMITPEEIEHTLRDVAGVNTVKVTYLNRVGVGGGRQPLIGSASELFVFSETNTSISAYSASAELTALTFSTGTLSPTFTASSPFFYNYNLTIGAVSSITATPTNATASAIYVNGSNTPVASGVASPAITTPVGTTTFTIRSIAADSTTVATYTINVIRAA